MAQLSNDDYGRLRDRIYRPDAGKAELKNLPNLPSEEQLTAAFQALEDRWENASPVLKGDIDTALGRTLPIRLAALIFIAWMESKLERIKRGLG